MTNKEFFIKQWQSELQGTLNALKALPTDLSKLSYSPDSKSRTALQIVEHIMPHPQALRES